MSDPTVLSFGDSLIRKSDLDILGSCQWLNDQIIGFFFEFCQNEKFQKNSFSFVGPEVTQFVKMVQQREIGIFLEPLDLTNKEAIFLAVNSNSDPGLAGGSHWSLLLFLKQSNQFLHFDSCTGSNNNNEAKVLATKVCKFLSKDLRLHFSEVDVTQQINGYDCGIHCIVNAENIADHLKAGKDIQTLPKVDQPRISKSRSELVKLIQSLSSKS
eukprot:TRINITY_DN55965_c0_g1_i1.p1 TRINITY_DN55965_c0_g1~~TRINITY_DN55965_c0_g1_i1.p1  ORF type:complete len:213 (-),score=56.11 TRINITY_DN55965_c0_g1_i1:36-674(-)